MSATLGIDLRGSMLCTASVEEAAGTRSILWLSRTPVAERIQFPDRVTLAVAIPDDAVMVKYYLMPSVAGSDIALRLQFEMEQSLLDDAGLFEFDSLKTGLADRYLGLISRKAALVELHERLGIPTEAATRSVVRGVALARGFRTFCRLPGGELGGVLDVAPQGGTFCLLYKGEAVSLGYLKIDGYDLAEEQSVKRLAMEIKTLVAFKLASLAEMGLTIPMSSLSLSGEVSDQLVEHLGRYFTSGLQRAEVNRALLGSGLDASVSPELFLPALGMTVI